MNSDLIPYVWAFFLTTIPMGLIYWLHCTLEKKKKKENQEKLAAQAQNLKLKKAHALASGFVGLSIGQSTGQIVEDESNRFLFEMMNDHLDMVLKDHEEIVDKIIQDMNEHQFNRMYDDMNYLASDLNIQEQFEEHHSDISLLDNFSGFDNDMMSSFDNLSSFDDSFSNSFSDSNTFDNGMDSSTGFSMEDRFDHFND